MRSSTTVKTLCLVMLATTVLASVALAQAQPRRPWLDPVSGKPFFPLGWYEWESGVFDKTDKLRWEGFAVARNERESLKMACGTLDEMAREGANTMVFINKWASGTAMRYEPERFKDNIELMNAYLDHARKRGIKVLVLLGPQAFEATEPALAARMLQNTRSMVESISKHPALLGYQIFDEPEFMYGSDSAEDTQKRKSFVNALGRLSDSIRLWDKNPNHTIQCVFNYVPHEGASDIADWKQYLPTVNGFQLDRYPIGTGSPYFPQGDWGALRMAWEVAYAVDTIAATSHLSPCPVLQAVGLDYKEGDYWWRDPIYEETRYMAYSSLTVGGWGVIHWIRNPSPASVRSNVSRLYKELRQLFPAFERSWEKPPFVVTHNHEGTTRGFLKDLVSDVSTLALEDDRNYYMIASDNSGVFEDLVFRMKLPSMTGTQSRKASVLNENWSREISYDPTTGEWMIPKHTMRFGDINVWVIPKTAR